MVPSQEPYFGRHVRFGWWSLVAFMSLGLVLDAMHGFKVGWYLDVWNETRRLMWTLAHTHGTLLAVLNIVFGVTARFVTDTRRSRRELASRCLIGAAVLMPAGFLLGGVYIQDGDPNPAVFLVPLGAIPLIAGVFMTARAVSEALSRPGQPEETPS